MSHNFGEFFLHSPLPSKTQPPTSTFFKKCISTNPRLDEGDTTQKVFGHKLENAGEGTITFGQYEVYAKQEPLLMEEPISLVQESAKIEWSPVKKWRIGWNLKHITSRIKEIIDEQEEITMKQIARILFEQFSSQQPTLSENQLAREEKNLKRRVCDSVNVMISLGMLQKQGKKIKKDYASRRNPLAGNRIKGILQEKQQDVMVKRKFFTEFTKQIINLNKLVDRNKATNHDKKFYFPLIMAQTKVSKDSDMVLFDMNGRGDQFRVLSQTQITSQGDLDILARLFSLNKEEEF